MSKLLLDAQERARVLLTIGRWRLFFVSLGSLTMSWLAITNQIKLNDLGWFDWVQTFIGCIGSWSVTMSAILLTQGKAIATGHIPGLEEVDDPESQTEIKTTTETTTKVVPPAP